MNISHNYFSDIPHPQSFQHFNTKCRKVLFSWGTFCLIFLPSPPSKASVPAQNAFGCSERVVLLTAREVEQKLLQERDRGEQKNQKTHLPQVYVEPCCSFSELDQMRSGCAGFRSCSCHLAGELAPHFQSSPGKDTERAGERPGSA